MRQVHQEIANNQQVAAELQTLVNDASTQLVLTDSALQRKWEAVHDDEERERLKNEFFHARSILPLENATTPTGGTKKYPPYPLVPPV